MNYKDNDSFGAGSYPEPEERDVIEVMGTITVTFNFNAVFDNDMTEEEIAEYIRDNPRDYMDEIDDVNEVEFVYR